MSVAALLDPYASMEISMRSDSKTMGSDVPLVRQDTQQLMSQAYRTWQCSPADSACPEPEERRVRRKPSIQNLTGRSALSAFSWTPSSIPPPSNHISGPHDSHLQQLSTPRPRTYTASPSLSSTITTLQSTPTHTPILRRCSFDEPRRLFDQGEPEGPVATKRKYPSVKHARRLPRRQADSQGSQNSGIYKVYAAVFDISGDQGGLSEESNKVDENDSLTQAAPNSRRDRTVRFTGIDKRRSDSTSRALSSGTSKHHRDQTATSSYSLSKFEFPAPPNRDNWASAREYLPTSPSAVVLYRGASFDLLNPHASLLLGTHSFETPAEIDGLLDDYFEDDDDDFLVMASDPGTGEATQQSLRSVSDTRQTNTLYEDMDTARRNILNIEDSTIQRNEAVIARPSPSAVAMPDFAREGLPYTRLQPARPSNTRARFGAIQRSMGFTTGNSTQDPAAGGALRQDTGTPEIYTAPEVDLASNGTQPFAQGGIRGSNPFDLEISEDRSNAELMGINGVLQRERDTVLESATDPYGQRAALTVDDGSISHALSESAPDFGSLPDRYIYPHENTWSTEDGYASDATAVNNNGSSDSVSVERGLNADANTEVLRTGWYTSVPPGEHFRSSHHGLDMFDRDSETMQLRPLAVNRNAFVNPSLNMLSVHGALRISETSGLHTSDQTYGDTNQLLGLSPVAFADSGPRSIAIHHTAPIHFRPEYDLEEAENTAPPEFDEHGNRLSLAREWTDPDRIEAYSESRRHSALVSIRRFDHTHNGAVMDDIEMLPQVRTGSVVGIPSIIFQDRDSYIAHRASYNDWETDTGVGTSEGLTESEDQNSDGSRFVTSGESDEGIPVSRPRPGPGVRLPLFRPHPDPDIQGPLALTSFPDLNNPRPEISPQRKVSKRQPPDGPPVSNQLSGGRHNERKKSPRRRHESARLQHVATRKDSGFAPGAAASTFAAGSNAAGLADSPSAVRYALGPFDSGFAPGLVDFDSEPTGDAKRALEIISNKASEDGLGLHRICAIGNHSPIGRNDTQELEFIRKHHPNAVKEATARFEHQQLGKSSSPSGPKSSPSVARRYSPAKLQKPRKMNPFVRPGYMPSQSFHKAVILGQHEVAHGSYSSRRELLANRTPAIGGLEYSESHGTFRTQRDRNSAELRSPLENYDPLESSPTARVLDHRRPTILPGGTSRLPSNLRFNGSSLSNQGRPTVGQQFELRSFRMRAENGPGRLTDQELSRREPHWQDNPASRGLPYTNAKLLPHILHREQKGISMKYLSLARLIPFAPLAYGLGWLDRVIVKKTHGRITSMGRKQKRMALFVYLPLQLLLFTIIGIVVGIIAGLQT